MGATIVNLVQRHLPKINLVVIDRPHSMPTASDLSAGVVTPFCGTSQRYERSLLAYQHYELLHQSCNAIRKTKFLFFGEQPDIGGPIFSKIVKEVIPKSTTVNAIFAGRQQSDPLWHAGYAYIVDVPKLVTNYLTTHRLSFTILREEVNRVLWKNGVWNLSMSEKYLSADRVIWATGPWANAQYSMLTGAKTKKIVAFDITAKFKPTEQSEFVYLLRESAFLMPNIKNNGWLLSITSKDWDCDPTTPVFVNQWEEDRARSIIAEYLPGLRGASLRSRVAVDSYTADGNPLVVGIDGGARSCGIVGASGSGVRFAPALAFEALKMVDLSL